jgi:hypothetical protein
MWRPAWRPGNSHRLASWSQTPLLWRWGELADEGGERLMDRHRVPGEFDDDVDTGIKVTAVMEGTRRLTVRRA